MQLQELIDITFVEGKLRRGALVDDGAKLRRSRVHHRRNASNLYHVSRSADLQREVNAYDFVEIEDDSLARVFLEALAGGIDLIRPHGHFEEDVFAIRARLHLARGVGRFVDQRDLRPRYRAAARVYHRAADTAAGALCARKWRPEAHCHRQHHCE